MKQTTAIGIVLAVALMMVAVILEGGSPAAFINIPAFLIVFGGTLGVVVASQSIEISKAIPKLMILAFKGQELDHRGAITQMVGLAEKARREGLLALEDDIAQIDDPYVKKGLQLVVDGADSDMIRGVLDSEIAGMEKRHAANENCYRQAGGFAPTIGILGAVLGLIHVMENLSDPSKLGGGIATAFVATVYGVGAANIFFLPFASKLKRKLGLEKERKTLIAEGVLSIQEGVNPRVLEEKLRALTGEDGPPADADRKAA
jgi:chemotaxis protein MotA